MSNDLTFPVTEWKWDLGSAAVDPSPRRLDPPPPRQGPVANFSAMSLRDWFAGQALVGLLASGREQFADSAEEEAYMFADAMLKERSK